MVADRLPQCVRRSLVRVPGSGRGQGASALAVSCDLGKVSSLAASIMVDPYLPAIMAAPSRRVLPSTTKTATNKLATTQASLGLPSSLRQTHGPAPSPEADHGAGGASKRPRLDVRSPSSSSSSSRPSAADVTVHLNQPQPPAASVPQGTSQSLGTPTARRVLVARRSGMQQNTTRSIEDLQDQQHFLQENRVLIWQLATMQLIQARIQARMQRLVPPAANI